MRGVLLGALLALLFVVPASAASTARTLWLTNEKAEDALPIYDQVYLFGDEPGSAGTVAIGANAVYYGYSVHFVRTMASEETFLGNATLRLPLRCPVAHAGASNPTVTMYVESSGITSVGSAALVGFPLACTAGQILDTYAIFDLDFVSLLPNEDLLLIINSPLGSPGQGVTLEILTGDSAHPAGLFGNTTAGGVFLPAQVSWSAPTGAMSLYGTHQWSTSADGANLTLDAKLSEGRSITIEITDFVTGDQIKRFTFDAGSKGKTFHEEAVLNAGNHTRWSIDTNGILAKGDSFSYSLVPVSFEVTEVVAPPENVTATVPTLPTLDSLPLKEDGKDSPLGLVALAAIAVALLLRRQTPP